MEIFRSKKFIMSIGGVVAVIVGHFLKVPEEAILQVVGIVAAYLVGQGLSDVGKGAAEVEASVADLGD